MYKLVVLFCCVAAAVAKPGLVAYSSVVPAVSSVSQYSSSVVHGSPYLAAPVPAVYSGAVVAPYAYGYSQAPHSPAVVLDAVHGVPLDTPEVVAARAAHFQAKALSLHHLKKRSVVSPVAYSSVVSPVAYSSPLVSAYSSHLVSPYSASVVASPYAYSASPYAYSASPYAYSAYGVVPKAYGVHPW